MTLWRLELFLFISDRMKADQITYEQLLEKVNALEQLSGSQRTQIESLQTELISTKARADESEEIFSLFLKNCPIYVFFKDSQIRVLRLSSNFSQLVGLPTETLIGKTMDEIFPPELAKSMMEDDLRILINGEIVEIEEELNGHYYYTIKFPIHRAGKPSYLAGFTMDITERKLAEISFKQNSKILQELNNTKDKLFSVISHDLRNSFNTILGFTELLRTNIQDFDSERVRDMSSHIYVASKNTYSLLSNLLDWAKSHLDQLNATKIEVDALTVIRNVSDELRPLALKKSVHLHCSNNESIRVEADINMLSTILRNLISNAIKYCKVDGEIIISVVDCGNVLEFSVSDNGVGMSDETKKIVFLSNINVSQDGTDHEKGTGLGLVICKEFVEKQGGEIWIESVLGKGCTFKFTLPRE